MNMPANKKRKPSHRTDYDDAGALSIEDGSTSASKHNRAHLVYASTNRRKRVTDPIVEKYKLDMESLRQQAVEIANNRYQAAIDQIQTCSSADNAMSEEYGEKVYWLSADFETQMRRIGKIYPAKEASVLREVMSMGSEDTNALGLMKDPYSYKQDYYLPTIVRNLPPEDIVAVAAGGQTSAALTDEGNLYTWGSNDEFALGRKVGMDEEHLVKKMEAPAATDKEAKTRMNPGFMRNVTQVRMGDSHSLVLTIDGKVYSTGMYKDSDSGKWRDLSSAQRKLWLDFTNKSKEEQAAIERSGNIPDGPEGNNLAPTLVDKLPGKVVWIECGLSWNVVQLEDGTLWTWGMGISGELARSRSMGAKVTKVMDYKAVEGTTERTRPPIGEMYEIPKKDVVGNEAIDPKSGNTLTEPKYKTYELGKSFMGTFREEVVLDKNGNPKIDKKSGSQKTESRFSYDVQKVLNTFLTPGPVEWAGPLQKREVLQFACGMLHFVVVARDAGVFSPRVYSTGGNNYGQLGHGDLFERHELTPILSLDDERISMAACGDFHTLALAMDGSTVFSWGRSDSGQLGLYQKPQDPGALVSYPREVPFPEDAMLSSRVVDISCGSFTSFALTSVGTLFSWGYNDSGATGHPSDNSNDIHLPKLVELRKTRVEVVAAGGQHSLFLVKRYK